MIRYTPCCSSALPWFRCSLTPLTSSPAPCPEQTDRGEPHRPTWSEDRGRLRPPGDPGRGGRQHQPAGSSERDEAGRRLVPRNPGGHLRRNHHHQSVPPSQMFRPAVAAAVPDRNACAPQSTTCWWSPGAACCWCLRSGRRRPSREPAATSLCTWT